MGGERDRWARLGLLQVPLKKEAGCVRSPAGALAAKVGSGEHGQLGSFGSHPWFFGSE